MAIAIKIHWFIDLPIVGATACRAKHIYILSALTCDVSASFFITSILCAENISWARYTLKFNPKTSREMSNHKCWCYLITFISRIDWHRCGTSSSQASSGMYAFGIIITIEPFGELKFLYKSLKYFLSSLMTFDRK